jgi:deoxynucleoside triphosphate triphosphohydrolase SAMHD1
MSINYNFKRIYDNIHGYIVVSNLACNIIDTKYFQRLRSLKQLGTCNYVFIGAIHTRFEHSIGTYYLAGKLLDCIIDRTNKKLLHTYLKKNIFIDNYFKRINNEQYYINDYIKEIIKIAALCHDLGHGPFSHVFDDIFLPSLRNDSKKKIYEELHENRSCLILEKIISNNNFLKNNINKNEINFIKSLINPSKENTSFLYQIVSNNLNGLDVDKYDYLMRDTKNIGLTYSIDCSRLVDDIYVIDNNICYPRQVFHDIKYLFETRYRLHKEVYTHRVVISYQFMICDIMNLLNNILNISDSIYDVDKFCKLNDDFILNSINFLTSFIDNNIIDKKIIKAGKLLNKLNNRSIYKFIDIIVLTTKKLITWKTFNNIDSNINEDDVCIHNSKIGFVSGNKKHPLNEIYYFNTKNTLKNSIDNKSFKLDKEDITKMMSDIHQEYILMIYSKKEDKINLIKNVWNNLKKKMI